MTGRGRVVAAVALSALVSAYGCSSTPNPDDDDDSAGESGAPGSGGSAEAGRGPVGCTPGEASCAGARLTVCNAEGDGFAADIDCSPGTCVTTNDGAECQGGGSGGSSGGTGGSGGSSGGSGGSSGAGASGGSGGGSGGDGGSGGSGGGSGGSGGSTGGTGGSGGSTGGSGGGGTGGSAGATGPCDTEGFYLCDCLPAFGSGEQVLDGAGDDFDQLPAMSFDVMSMPYIHPDHDFPAEATATVRAAWTADAFVAHVHVSDPLVVPDTGSTLWNGDAVQFFVAGTDLLTGAYSGTEDAGATHVIVSPPTDTTAARAITIYEPCYACVTTSVLATSSYAARTVADGYEVELRLPWAADAVPRVSGARVALDLVIDVANRTTSGLELEGALKNDPTLASTSCSPTPTTHPGCDDRVWCTPRLE